MGDEKKKAPRVIPALKGKAEVQEWSTEVPYVLLREEQEDDGEDPRDTPPPIIYGEEIDDPCNPLYVNGILRKNCKVQGIDTPSTCKGKITGFIFPGSKWEGAVGAAITEINRAFAFYAQYCIFLGLEQMNISAKHYLKLKHWYYGNPKAKSRLQRRGWFRSLVKAIGGKDKLGKTTIPTGLVDEFRLTMRNLQRLARRSGVKLLVVFIDEYITDHRPTLISGVRKKGMQVGITWLDRGSPYILAHELVHALGKPGRNRTGAVTWSHNSPCKNAITTIKRPKGGGGDNRPTVDLSNRYLEVAEFKEIVESRGAKKVLECESGKCPAP